MTQLNQSKTIQKLYASALLTVALGSQAIGSSVDDSFLPLARDFGAPGYRLGVVYEDREMDERQLPSIMGVVGQLNQKIIGEEKAMEALGVAWHTHMTIQMLNSRLGEGEQPIPKSNVLLMGPTGSGKTASVSLLAQIAKVPYYIADASTMTRTGYVGDSADSVLMGLLRRANYNVAEAERGIIFVDEIDKKAMEKGTTDSGVASSDVQSEFLKLLEGKKVTVSVPSEDGASRSVEVDTSKILFIAGGAFSKLPKKSHYTAEDIVSYGFMPEFVGRFGKFIQLQGMTEDKLFSILKSPEASPLTKNLKLLREGYHVNVNFDDSVLRMVSREAFRLGTGARGLSTAIQQITDPIIAASEILRYETVTVDDRYIQRVFPNLYAAAQPKINETPLRRLLSKFKATLDIRRSRSM